MKRLTVLLTLPLLTSLACTDDGPATDDEIGTDSSTGDGDGDTTTETETSTSTSDTETDTETTAETETTTETETTAETETDTETDTTETTDGEVCGNGVVDAGEECDDGPANADDAACTSACLMAICGDGLVHVDVEACDAAGESAECNDDCSAAACGDSKLNVSAGEICDGDVGMVSCADEGFLGGELACDAMSCDYDTSGCYLDFEATFSSCGQTGHTGPTQGQCDAAYANTSLAGDVTVTAGYQSWTVPFTATYSIEVWGAQGGNHNFGAGGLGARVKGDFDLNQGDVLQILVGQKGKDGTAYDVGGGGGSFVALADDTPLIVGGGGGGAGNCGQIDAGQITGKSLLGDGTGGSGGNDGSWCGCGGDGSPGGGFNSNGMPVGGKSFLNGGLGDDTERPGQCVDSGLGGFGGGGNGGNGGGGGGGYEGGDAGGSIGNGATGKGGESYNDGANPEGQDGIKQGHGQVIITLLP